MSIENAAKWSSYVAVDWSAAGVPKGRADSIWIHERARGAEDLPPLNPRTRVAAMADLRDRFRRHLDAGRSVLAGFDFAFGYPAGTADALAPASRFAGEPWERLWTRLAGDLEDDKRNGNNRFVASAGLNRELAGDGPFWGCPPTAAGEHLRTTKPAFPSASGGRALAEFRLAERLLNARSRAKVRSVWQLSYAGCVGSQSLLGIHHLVSLRADAELGAHVRVWPFEFPLASADLPEPCVLVAEIWPGLFPLELRVGEIRDEQQVRAVTRGLVSASEDGSLATWLHAPAGHAPAAEEGWILGVT